MFKWYFVWHHFETKYSNTFNVCSHTASRHDRATNNFLLTGNNCTAVPDIHCNATANLNLIYRLTSTSENFADDATPYERKFYCTIKGKKTNLPYPLIIRKQSVSLNR